MQDHDLGLTAQAPAAPSFLRRAGTKLLHELRSALPPTIFFFIGFNFIVLTTNLLVADYAVAVSSFMLATTAALVVGKAVITANAMPFLRLFDRALLASADTRFVLAGIVNRMDRAYVAEGGCGEIRLIYRLTRTDVAAGGETPVRLPVTLNVILRAAGDPAVDRDG